MNTRFHTATTVAAALCLSLLLAACGSSSSRHLGSGIPPGGGGGNPLPPPTGGGFPPPPPPPTPGPGQILLTGLVTYDRVPFSATAGNGLDFAAIDDTAAVRGATVEIIDADTGDILDSRQTSATGTYAFALPASTDVFVRVKAELVREVTAPTWDFRVLDNTDGNALYALDSVPFNTGTAATFDAGNLHAGSGWNAGSGSYDDAERSAAPFAILDIAYRNLGFVLAADPDSELPPLELYWSTGNNVSVGSGDFEADLAAGDIGTTFYVAPGEVTLISPAGIYILGEADEDTDEFDSHVLAHEWAHYFQDMLARDDSLGGSHDFDSSIDLTVAFSEGWADAFSGMTSGDPDYRDSFDVAQGADFSLDLEDNTPSASPGWFNEGSIASILYDLNDADADGETLQIGFGSIRAALEGSADTDAFTSIYPFVRRLTAIETAVAADIEGLLTAQDIVAQPADDFGSNETNDDGDVRNLPIYTEVAINGASPRLCVTGSPAASYNALGNRRYLRFEILGVATAVTITVDGAAGAPSPASTDPDAFLYLRGDELAGDEESGAPAVIPLPGDPPLVLDAGTYVIDAYDFRWIQDPPSPFGSRCFDVTVSSP